MIDALYSTKILRLAANLPRSGRLVDPHGTGEQIAKLCGSRAIIDVRLGEAGHVVDFAQDIKACALGQAAAGIIGQVVIGTDEAELAATRDAMLAMLKSGGPGPEGRFAELRLLAQVADYPARHASTLVGLEATLNAVRAAQNRRAQTVTDHVDVA